MSIIDEFCSISVFFDRFRRSLMISGNTCSEGHSRYKGGNSGNLVTPILASWPKGIIKPSLRVRENLGLV